MAPRVASGGGMEAPSGQGQGRARARAPQPMPPRAHGTAARPRRNSCVALRERKRKKGPTRPCRGILLERPGAGVHLCVLRRGAGGDGPGGPARRVWWQRRRSGALYLRMPALSLQRGVRAREEVQRWQVLGEARALVRIIHWRTLLNLSRRARLNAYYCTARRHVVRHSISTARSVTNQLPPVLPPAPPPAAPVAIGWLSGASDSVWGAPLTRHGA